MPPEVALVAAIYWAPLLALSIWVLRRLTALSRRSGETEEREG